MCRKRGTGSGVLRGHKESEKNCIHSSITYTGTLNFCFGFVRSQSVVGDSDGVRVINDSTRRQGRPLTCYPQTLLPRRRGCCRHILREVNKRLRVRRHLRESSGVDLRLTYFDPLQGSHYTLLWLRGRAGPSVLGLLNTTRSLWVAQSPRSARGKRRSPCWLQSDHTTYTSTVRYSEQRIDRARGFHRFTFDNK